MSLQEHVTTTRRRNVGPTNARELLIATHKRHPNQTREDVIQRFVDRFLDADDAIIMQVAREWAQINYRNLIEPPTPEAKERNRQEAATIAERVSEVASRSIAKLALSLDFLMPNGKKLRECTFSECGQLGGMFGKIAAAGKPNQIVGEKLSDKKLQALLK